MSYDFRIKLTMRLEDGVVVAVHVSGDEADGVLLIMEF